VEFRILGPLEVSSGDELLPLGGPNQRALLAILLLRANESVRRASLIDEIWGESPPKTADVSLNGYVSKLRKLLANGSGTAIETRPDGYSLRLVPDQLDSHRFESLVADARQDKVQGRHQDAQKKIAAALQLWRGAPLSDFVYAQFAQSEIARLEELRLAAVEERYETELELGHPGTVVGDLEKLAADHPFRERPTALLMLALYRAGRQAEALQAYERMRRSLAEELGLEPSEGLQDLHRRILRRDPELAPRASAEDGRGFARSVRTRLLVGVVATAGAVALVAAFAFARGAHGVRVAQDSLGIFDPMTDRFVGDVPVGRAPTLVTYGSGAAWVVNEHGRVVSRVDARTGRVEDNISAPARVTGMAVGDGSIWIASSDDGRVRRVDSTYNRLAGGSTRACDACGSALAFGEGGLWTTDGFTTLARIDPRSLAATRAPAELLRGAHDVAAGSGLVWVAGDGVTRVDPTTLLPAGVPIPTGPAGAIVLGGGAVWAVVDNRVVEIDPRDGSVEASVRVGNNPSSLAAGGGAIWVANSSSGTVSKIDPTRAAVVDTIHVGRSPVGLAFGGGKLWVSAQ
jgi:YVTN family beta-propeller protein